ncbi:hypothetical protein NUSPORA_00220 [Nucleospora cyclopteri]
MANKIVQFIFVRSDLNLSKGALIAQACHATTKAIHQFYDKSNTIDYLKDIDNLTKIILRIKENDIKLTHEICEKNNIFYCDWIEQPENILTAIATAPTQENDEYSFKKIFSKFKLF